MLRAVAEQEQACALSHSRQRTPGVVLAALSGRVITPDDVGYDAARTVFYRGIDRRPALIARVANAADIVRAIALAREAGLELAVRSGGHSLAGHSVSDGGNAAKRRD